MKELNDRMNINKEGLLLNKEEFKKDLYDFSIKRFEKDKYDIVEKIVNYTEDKKELQAQLKSLKDNLKTYNE